DDLENAGPVGLAADKFLPFELEARLDLMVVAYGEKITYSALSAGVQLPGGGDPPPEIANFVGPYLMNAETWTILDFSSSTALIGDANTRTVSAGISANTDLSVVAIRCEYGSPQLEGVSAWTQFFAGQFPQRTQLTHNWTETKYKVLTGGHGQHVVPYTVDQS